MVAEGHGDKRLIKARICNWLTIGTAAAAPRYSAWGPQPQQIEEGLTAETEEVTVHLITVALK